MPSEDIAGFLKKHATEVRGTICVFGDWFGRPHDNWHSVVAYEFKEGHLSMKAKHSTYGACVAPELKVGE
jgi:hypothetical protein